MTDQLPFSTIDNVLQTFLKRASEYETNEFFDLAREWMRVQSSLQAAYDGMAAQIAGMKADGKPITESSIHRLERYQSLLAQAQQEVNRFNRKADSLISDGQQWHIEQGISKGSAEIDAIYQAHGVIDASFDLLPAKALEHMVGHLGDGSPLSDLLKFDYKDTAGNLANLLVDSTAKGINPRITAQSMANYMDGNLDRSMVIARTEQIRSFRTASVEEYKTSGVVDGYERHCDFSDRTCMACVALDGQVYTLEEQFSDHPDGRCFSIPHVKNMDMGSRSNARDWFEKQSTDVQISMMGEKVYDAWKSGKFTVRDLGVISHSDIWGEQIKKASLEDLLND